MIEDSWKCIFIHLLYVNLDCQTYNYSNRLLVTIDFVKRHAWNYFNSFIHIMYTILYQWSNDIQHVYCLVNTHKSLFKFFYWFYMTNKCQMWISKIMLYKIYFLSHYLINFFYTIESSNCFIFCFILFK